MEHFDPGSFGTLANTEQGRCVWEKLHSSPYLSAMETATLLGRPAVEGIEELLLKDFGPWCLEDRTKQMIGRMVRQIMESRGFVVDQNDVKITNGAPFSRGTRYKRLGDRVYHVFQSSEDGRRVALTWDKSGAALRSGVPGETWLYSTSFVGRLRGAVRFGIQDFATVEAEITAKGFSILYVERILRRA